MVAHDLLWVEYVSHNVCQTFSSRPEEVGPFATDFQASVFDPNFCILTIELHSKERRQDVFLSDQASSVSPCVAV